ncbi:MAG TPA: hypothetical protein VF020_05280 [Chthoniobacterales bacterium]
METDTKQNWEKAIEIAQQAFDELGPVAFWNWNPNTRVTDKNLDRIIRALRSEGGRKGYYFVHLIQHQLKGQNTD